MKLRGNLLRTVSTISASLAIFAVACGGEPAPSAPPLTGAVSVSVGKSHTCATIDDGTLRCWGFGAFGELGNGEDDAWSSRPLTVKGLGGVSAVEAGAGFTCALDSAGTVSCWGVNLWGATGLRGTTIAEPAPVTVKGLSGPVGGLSAGEGHTICARMVSGTIECWGNTIAGFPTDPQSFTFGATALPGLTAVRAVAANDPYACALLEAGTVSCWGVGPLGQPDGISSSISEVPVAVPGLDDCVEISLGESHACARRVDGTVKCWGWVHAEGGWDSATPVPVDALGGAVAIASAESTACAVRNDGTVRCVGTLDTPSHGPVPGVDDAVSVSVGPSSACAVIADGTIRCWGDGNYGQLGDGRLDFSTGDPPVQSGVRVVAPEAPTAAPAP